MPKRRLHAAPGYGKWPRNTRVAAASIGKESSSIDGIDTLEPILETNTRN